MPAAPTKTEKIRKKVVFVGNAPVGPGLNDRRADDEAVLGQFVTITKGEHEGVYGVFTEAFADEDGEVTQAVVRSRDNDTARYVVPIADLEPALAGRR